jgi:hypothetical protein
LTLNMKEIWYLKMQRITDAVTRRHVPDDPSYENENTSYIYEVISWCIGFIWLRMKSCRAIKVNKVFEYLLER